MTYKITDKARKEKFGMLTDLTVDSLNFQIAVRAEDPEFPHQDYLFVKLSRYSVAFKDPEMNKLCDSVAFYTFIVHKHDIEDVDMKEHPKEIDTGVWYDVEDLLNGEYDIEEAIGDAVDVLACEASAANLKLKDNFTGSHRKYRAGYLDSNGDGIFLYSRSEEFPLKNFVRLMFIPAETPEEEYPEEE